MKEIVDHLYELRDEEYAKFQSNLTPTLTAEDYIGVRTPLLRKYAKEIAKSEEYIDLKETFLKELPHKYFDENQLHAFIISEEKDYEKCMQMLEEFLPYVNNWATCDQMSPKIFKKHLPELSVKTSEWIDSDLTYTIRFGIGMRMKYYLDDEFDLAYSERISKVRSEEYYVNMMVAWYFATALAKQYDAIVPYLEQQKLDIWTHNKTIQKAIESYRITPEQKIYLRTLKRKK